MIKNLSFIALFDIYSGLLTEQQRRLFQMYYHQDLSLNEAAELTGITKQAVRDSVKKSEAHLLKFEQALKINEISSKVIDICDRSMQNPITEHIQEIKAIIQTL